MTDKVLHSHSAQNEMLERWMTEYGDYIQRMCYLYLANSTLAEDAAQDTFLKAWRAAKGFEGRNGCTEKTWLTRIAINTCQSVKRSAWFKRVDRKLQPEDVPQLAPDLESDQGLYAEILRLPEKLKPVLFLRYYQGYSLDEVATMLHVNRSTVYHRQQKALELLRRTLERSELDD
ncbi:MAG: RNA polymerase sigma factor [Clostridia bacterium]